MEFRYLRYLWFKVYLHLVHHGILWPHGIEELHEIWAADKLVDQYNEWKWERDNPDDRVHFDWSDPTVGYKIEQEEK